MNSVIKNIQLAEKRCRDKLKKNKNETRLNNKNPKKNAMKKWKKLKKTIKNTNINLINQKDNRNTAENQYESNKRKVLFRKENETKKETKQIERKQNREKLIEEDIDLSRFFELTSSGKIYVTRLNLHEN